MKLIKSLKMLIKYKQNLTIKYNKYYIMESDNKDKTIINEEIDNFSVTVENVSGRIDYEKLIKKFGTEKVTKSTLEKFERVTGKPLHPWLKRGIFFSHRDLDQFLDAYENGDPVFLYTGRGPSSDAMHIGHLIPFIFTKWLQDVFDCPLVIQLSDEEKYAFKKGTFEELHKMGFENSKDIISAGFNSEKTFIFSNRDYRLKCPKYEMFVSDLKVNASVKEVSQIFGFKDDGNVGMYDWPFYQSAASFSQAFPHIFSGRPAYCLIPCAIDQDPYFRLGRDLAQRMKLLKTSTLYSTFLPPLKGLDDGKMSSSLNKESTIFLNDDANTIKKKVMIAKSGSRGNGSLEDHKRLGGDVAEDIACEYLRYFELDDEKLEKITTAFSKGEMTCGETKNLLAEKIVEKLLDVQEKRKKVSKEVLEEFFAIKKMPLPLPKEKERTEDQKVLEEYLTSNKIEFSTTYHHEITSQSDFDDLKMKLEGVLCRVNLLYSQEKFILTILNHSSVLLSDRMKLYAKQMGLKKLAFANADTGRNLLKCETNYSSALGLIFDKESKINEIWVDTSIKSLFNKEEIEKSNDMDEKLGNYKLNFFALRKDAHITMKCLDFLKFLSLSGKREIKDFNPNSEK